LTAGPSTPITYTESQTITNVQVTSSPFGGINNSAYFIIPANGTGGVATSLTMNVSMSGYTFPDPPSTSTDDSYWVTVYVDGNPIYDVQYINTTGFSQGFNLASITSGYDENSIIEIYIYPNSFAAGGINTTFIPGGGFLLEGEWSASTFAVTFNASFIEEIPTAVSCVFPTTESLVCCTPSNIGNGSDNVCSGSTGSFNTWKTSVENANPNCLVFSSVTPIAGATLPDNTLPTGVNNSCAPITQSVNAYAYCDVNGNGNIDAGDSYALLSSFVLSINPAPPSFVTNNGACGIAPSALLNCGGSSILSDIGIAPNGLPCGTGVNTSTITGTFTAAQIATALGGATASCYFDQNYNLTASCNQNSPVSSTDLRSACTSFVWIDGNTYNSNNTSATFTISNGASNGCDSIVSLNLTINSIANGLDVVSSCLPIIWIDGNTYNANNNSATFTISNGASNGCDSIVTLNLTISSAVNGTNVQTSCGAFTWIDGNTYNASNNSATFLIPNGASNGCDSIVTLNLTISSALNGTDVQTSCGAFTWIDGNTYNTNNNSATFLIPNGASNGCDSIVTLNLTISSALNGTDVQTSCGAFTWIDGNTYNANNNSATFLIPNGASNGCDSIVTLSLTFSPSISGIDVQAACGSLTWIDGNTYNSSNNTATFLIPNGAGNGCDSLVTLNLTISPAPVLAGIVGGNSVVCQNESFALQTSYIPQGTYYWEGPNGFTSNDNPVFVQNADLTNTGIYTVYAVNGNCVSDTLITDVGIFSFNNLSVSTDAIDYVQGETASITATGAMSYQWDPVDYMNNPNGSIVTLNDMPPGDYTYTVYGMDMNTCLDSTTVSFTVLPRTELLIYDVVSPNGDGYNDTWFIGYLENVDTYVIRIFDRGGMLLHEVFNQYNNDWDGSYEGNDLPEGAYYYYIEAGTDIYKGGITIVR
ncbi:MAG: gliding motility-associated-like protein, partial [Chitinophagales bacterium]